MLSRGWGQEWDLWHLGVVNVQIIGHLEFGTLEFSGPETWILMPIWVCEVTSSYDRAEETLYGQGVPSQFNNRLARWGNGGALDGRSYWAEAEVSVGQRLLFLPQWGACHLGVGPREHMPAVDLGETRASLIPPSSWISRGHHTALLSKWFDF